MQGNVEIAAQKRPLPWAELTYSYHHQTPTSPLPRRLIFFSANDALGRIDFSYSSKMAHMSSLAASTATTATTDLARHLTPLPYPIYPKTKQTRPKNIKQGQNRQTKPATQPTRIPNSRSPSRPPRRAPPSPSTPLAAPTRTSAWVSRRSPSRHLRPRRPPKRRGRSGGSCTCPTCPGPSPRRRSRSSSRSSAPSRASR
jgi:hypothetical protein